MIRALVLLLVFALGLAAALAWYGQVHHLRRAVPDALPGWTEALPDTASLRDGELIWQPTAGGPAITTAWRAAAPSADGLRWRLAVTGPGLDLSASALVPWAGPPFTVDGGTGTVDLASATRQAVVQGQILLTALDATVTPQGGGVQVGAEATGEARRVSLAGTDLGRGPMTASLEPTGGWKVSATLDGGATPVRLLLSGALDADRIAVTLEADDPAALPEALRAVLPPPVEPGRWDLAFPVSILVGG